MIDNELTFIYTLIVEFRRNRRVVIWNFSRLDDFNDNYFPVCNIKRERERNAYEVIISHN